MNILFVITGLGIGGAERQVVDLAEQFAQHGHKVMIAYLTGEARLLPSRADIGVTALGITKSLAGFLHGYLALRRLIATFQPDVVHSHMIHANLLARLVRLTTRMPRLICSAHSTNEGGRLRMLAYRLTDFLADLSTNVSHEAVDAFERKGAVPAGKMRAVINGVDTARFCRNDDMRRTMRQAHGIAPNEKIILAVGRLVDAKDYPNLLHAFAAIDDGKVRLWIAGDGERLATLRKLATELRLGDRVAFLGARRDIPALLNAADIYVLSSAWEGFGLAVAEAMACEKIAIATDCGGVKEVLGECGLLVAPRDSQALANAMRQALAMDAKDASLLGARARQRISARFSLESAEQAWHTIYKI